MSFHVKNGESYVKGDFSKLENLIKELESKYYVDIGILGEQGATVEGNLTIAGVGAVHEFGTDKAGRNRDTIIPERSFIKMPLETGGSEIEKSISPKVQKFLEESNIEGLFKLIGIAGEARIQEAFDTGGFGQWPDLAESTIKGKGGSTAKLIVDGILRKSITSKVGK